MSARRFVLLLLPSVALTVVAVLFANPAELRAAVAADLAYLGLIVLQRLRRAWPVTLDAPPQKVARADGAALPALKRLDDALLFSRSSALDYERQLRPELYAIAAARLRRRGVDPDAQPERAEFLLGAEAWAVLAPPAQLPDRDAPGLSLERLRSTVKALEEV